MQAEKLHCVVDDLVGIAGRPGGGLNAGEKVFAITSQLELAAKLSDLLLDVCIHVIFLDDGNWRKISGEPQNVEDKKARETLRG
jgi:hypothetical protein